MLLLQEQQKQQTIAIYCQQKSGMELRRKKMMYKEFHKHIKIYQLNEKNKSKIKNFPK